MFLKGTSPNWINDLSSQRQKKQKLRSLASVDNPLDLVPLITECSSIEELQAITVKLRDYFGFDIVTFGQLAINKQQASGYILARDNSSYSCASKWIEHYKKSIFSNDPVIQWARERSTPIVIDDAHKPHRLTPESSNVLNVMHDFSVNQSLLIPVRASDCHHFVVRLTSMRQKALPADDLKHNLPLITLISLHLSEAFTRLFTAPEVLPNEPSLTKKELMILTLAASGHNTKQIAERLNVSANTVLYHMKNIHKKFNVSTRQHAIAKALSLGLLSL